MRDPQRHLNPIIFRWKCVPFALHTEAYFKFCFCESVLCETPKDTWILLFSHGNTYILLSILRLTLNPVSAKVCCAWLQKTPESKKIKCIHFAFHIEAHFKSCFCESVLCVSPKDTWILFSCGDAYILLSILRLTLNPVSAKVCCAWPPKTFES